MINKAEGFSSPDCWLQRDCHPHCVFIALLCEQKDLIALLKVIWNMVIDFLAEIKCEYEIVLMKHSYPNSRV